MILSDDDRPIRLRPRKPRTPRNEGAAWSSAYRLLMHYARGHRKTGRGGGGVSARARPRNQRCAVRITYLSNRTRGQWKAHGRYLAREAATTNKDGAAGFTGDREGVDVARELETWQSAGDQRLWKLILSPEFGDRLDLKELTRDVAKRMAIDLGTDLEWIAVEHHNTEHAHVHMVVRGIRTDGLALRFPREYVREGVRGVAEDACTRQLGYRTELDAAEAERREVGATRFTSLDRTVLAGAREGDATHFTVSLDPAPRRSNQPPAVRANHVAARLVVLQRMGLAEPEGANSWRVRRDLEQVLRAMQRTADRQKTLAAHGVPISDQRLRTEVLDLRHFSTVEGRILVHGQDEQSGQNYLALEGTDAKVHFVFHTPELEELRAEGGLKPNSYIRLRKPPAGSRLRLDVRDFGDADALLKNRQFITSAARALLRQGAVQTPHEWGGWLGRYQAALAAAALEIERSRNEDAAKTRNRRPDRSRGR